MLDLNGIEVTPALCGMMDSVAIITFMSSWEECVLQILKAEKDIIYQSAFTAIELAKKAQGNKIKGFEIYYAHLDDAWKSNYLAMLEFHTDKNLTDIKKVFLEAAFHQYWLISLNSDYWKRAFKLNQKISYEEAMNDWKVNNQDIIVTYMDNLNYWNNRMQGLAA